jgi:hypothetical protein
LFSLAIVLTLVWAVGGYKVTQRIADTLVRTPEGDVEKITKKLEAEDPHAAAELKKIRENRDIRAVAAVLHDAEARGGISAVRHLAERSATSGSVPAEIRLASLAVNPNLLDNATSRDNFLWAHATALQVLGGDETGEAGSAYLDRLEQSARSPDSWRVAKANPMAMLVHEYVTDPAQREYYGREQDWLDGVIVDVTARAVVGDAEKGPLVSDVVRVAYENQPFFQQAATEQGLGSGSFFLFAEHGDVIRRLAGAAGGVPLDEVLEVVFANSDFLDRFKNDTPVNLAARLIVVRNRKPSVWRAARKTGLALRLNEDAPHVADKLLEKFSEDDIAALLYSGYENEVVSAAEAVLKFEDLGIYILNRYEGSKRFHQALKNNSIGPRLIPYVAKFSDQGLERLNDNKAWLDKYFQLDGTPKEEEWWTQIPGGAAADVARNWWKGYPNEWGELGWAALDVADAVLAIGTFGGFEAAKEAVEAGGKVALKRVAKGEAKREVLQGGKRASKVAAKGAREAAKKGSKSLLRQAVAQGGKLARVVERPAGRAWRFAVAAGRTVVVPAEKVLEVAKKSRQAWGALSARFRKVVYISLLAVSLFITISQRTIPALPKIGEAAGTLAGEVVKNGAGALEEGLRSAIETALGGSGRETWRFLSWMVVYVPVLFFLGVLAWKLWPLRRARLRHV